MYIFFQYWSFAISSGDNTQFSETEILDRFEFVSNNDPKLIRDVARYITRARN